MEKLILLPQDPADAKRILKKWLGYDNKVLLIVLGDTNIAFDTAKRAARFTGAPEEPRYVIHAPNHVHVIDILDALSDPKKLVADWNSILLIAVSITDVIRDKIERDGKLPTLPRLQFAWMRAEKN